MEYLGMVMVYMDHFGHFLSPQNVNVVRFARTSSVPLEKKILGEKLVKMLGFLSKLIFWTKIRLFE